MVDGTFDTDAGTPSGSWLGTNTIRLLDTVVIKDNQNSDIFVSKGIEFYYKSYLLSIIDTDEFLMNKGAVREPITETGDVTAQKEVYIVPQRIAEKDLPATVEIILGVEDDYYNAVNAGATTINQLELWVRYVPTDETSFTERVKSFNISAFSSDSDHAHLIPAGIEILKLAFILGDPTASSAGAEINNSRFTSLTFKRGANDELDSIRMEVLEEFAGRLYPNLRVDGTTVKEGEPTGLFIVPTLAFVKTDATEFKFAVSGSIAPWVCYIYK